MDTQPFFSKFFTHDSPHQQSAFLFGILILNKASIVRFHLLNIGKLYLLERIWVCTVGYPPRKLTWHSTWTSDKIGRWVSFLVRCPACTLQVRAVRFLGEGTIYNHTYLTIHIYIYHQLIGIPTLSETFKWDTNTKILEPAEIRTVIC